MCRKKTQEEFVAEIHNRFDNIEVIGAYTNARTGIKLYCKIHDFVFESVPTNTLKQKYACPICARIASTNEQRKSHEDFVDNLYAVNPDIECIGKYINHVSKIEVKCSKCGHIWYSTPASLLRGDGCKECAMKSLHNKVRKSHEDFMESFIANNPRHNMIEIMNEYKTCDTKIKCRCKVCNNTWEARPGHLTDEKRPSGCPYCKFSHGEMRIAQYLDAIGVRYERQKRFSDLIGIKGRTLSYDFYIPDINTLIEYQGEFHDFTVPYMTDWRKTYQATHDKLKHEYAASHGIKLLEIWYWDKDRIETILADALNGIKPDLQNNTCDSTAS